MGFYFWDFYDNCLCNYSVRNSLLHHKMSQTYSIACRDCKKHLWMAQSSCGEGYVYATPNHCKALYDFLTEHSRHNLTYDNNCDTDISEFEEIEVPPDA